MNVDTHLNIAGMPDRCYVLSVRTQRQGLSVESRPTDWPHGRTDKEKWKETSRESDWSRVSMTHSEHGALLLQSSVHRWNLSCLILIT